jgi:hypothetical protein
MSGARGIDLALDLARMPALAHSIGTPPLPTDILEVMRIALARRKSASRFHRQPDNLLRC